MSDPFASYAGLRLVDASVTIPMYGLWSAECTMATEDAIPSTGPLVIGDLTLQGFVYRSTPFAGARKVWLAAGAGGWRKLVDAKSYQSPVGVRLSTVLGDVASEVGETMGDVSGTIGVYYQRDADPAQAVLRRVGGPLWRIDPDGVTRIGSRPTDGQDVGAAFTLTNFDGGRGVAEVATETFPAWMPGRTFTAPTLPERQRIQSVTHHVSGDGVHRLTMMCRADSAPEPAPQDGAVTFDDRMMVALRQIIRAELARGFRNDGSDPIIDGGTGTDEHVATIEGVMRLLLACNVAAFTPGGPPPVPITDALIGAGVTASIGTANTLAVSLLALTASLSAQRSGIAKTTLGCANVRSG